MLKIKNLETGKVFYLNYTKIKETISAILFCLLFFGVLVYVSTMEVAHLL